MPHTLYISDRCKRRKASLNNFSAESKLNIMKYTEKVSNKLNELLQKNYDAEAGYKQAAEKVDNPQLQTFFNKRASDRYDFGHQIKNEIKSFGQEPEKGTSFTGDAHRFWMNIKSKFVSNDEEAMLEEAIRGEEAFVENYDEIINESNLPPSTQAILASQKQNVENALKNVKTLEVVA